MKKILFPVFLFLILSAAISVRAEETVWYNINGGKKYHRIPTCWTIEEKYWRRDMRAIPLSIAEEKKLKQCSKCFTEGRPIYYPITFDMISSKDKERYLGYFAEATKLMDPFRWENPHQEYIDMVNACIEMFKGRDYPNEDFYFGLPGENDLSFDDAVIMGYAILDNYSKVNGDRLKTFFPDAWVDVRVSDEHVYRIHFTNRINGGAIPRKGTYDIYIDAKSGAPICEIINY